jgi:peptidoglycan/LPS O-acetylase OafA/YrhL
MREAGSVGSGALSSPPRLGYRPALDGIRACAILAVLAFHGGTKLTGGFIGVDLFFVLSGFLITTLLLQEWWKTKTVDLRAFYGRRARRLLPALFLTIAAVGVISALDPGLNHGFAFPLQALATIFYAGNWIIAFDQESALGLLNHTWSLAVEEQFYILWPPLLVLALRKRWSTERVALLLLVAAVASAGLRAALWLVGMRQGLYFRSDTHADGLLLGCALAAARYTPLLSGLQRLAQSLLLAITAAAALVVIALKVGFSSFLFLGGYPIVAVCSATIINHVVCGDRSLLARVLSLRPLVWIGARSYGMYLFHLPVMAVLTPSRVGLAFWPTFVLRITVILITAAASYRLVETRFLRKNRLPGAPPHVQRAGADSRTGLSTSTSKPAP